MSDYQGWMLIISIAGLIFSAGGFTWLAMNHMKHAQESLDRLEERMAKVERGVARICGHLNINPPV